MNQPKSSTKAILGKIVSLLQTSAADMLLIGPITQDEADQSHLMVVIGSTVDREPHVGQMTSESRNDLQALRGGLITQVMLHKLAVEIRVFDDDLQLAKFGETLWPDKLGGVRAAIEVKRGSVSLH